VTTVEVIGDRPLLSQNTIAFNALMVDRDASDRRKVNRVDSEDLSSNGVSESGHGPPTVKLKLPSVVCVSTESARQFT
jgi:hypothetical protein